MISCAKGEPTDEVWNVLNIVIQASENERYEIQFDDYVMYTVRNKSYTAWDDYEIRKGNYLVKFDRSRLLDYYGEVIIHTADLFMASCGKALWCIYRDTYYRCSCFAETGYKEIVGKRQG